LSHIVLYNSFFPLLFIYLFLKESYNFLFIYF
jgi:hypothetical protein